MYKLVDRFTTHDGSIVPDGEPWSITQDMVNKYGSVLPPDKGCAICIFVRLQGGEATHVYFETNGGHNETHPIDELGWAHTSMFNPGSGYNSVTGWGPWSVQAEGKPSEIVDNIGLPDGHHISTWIVMGWDESGDGETGGGPDPVEPPAGYTPHLVVTIDGQTVYEYGAPQG